MMRTYFSVCRKEMLLLWRDKAGLAMLFIMPVVLVIISSLMQESGWGELTKNPKINVLVVDNDHGELSARILDGFNQSGSFRLIDSLDGRLLTDASARQAVMKGDYQIAVVMPEGATAKMQANVRLAVAKTLAGFGMGTLPFGNMRVKDSVEVRLYFDPAVKTAFKYAAVSSVKENYYKIQSEWMFSAFNQEMERQMPMYHPAKETFSELLTFREEYPSYKEEELIPNTTQHNVPAWTIFAMFFIIIPLTQSLIQEREGGSLFRLLTMPVSYMTFLMGKVGIYLMVCLVQTAGMLLAGIYLLPVFGMPVLEISGDIPGLIVMSFVIALASVGYGLMVGTIAQTHQQAAAFGSISTIILAAMGGLWVPIYLMPEFMRPIAAISPLNWAITGFYSIFLRGGGIVQILPEITRLFVFFLATVIITAIYHRIKSPLNT